MGIGDAGQSTKEEATMTAIKRTVTIQPGGRIEVVSKELPEGRQVEIIILMEEDRPSRRFTDFIGAGQGLYPDIQSADRAIREERDAWGP